MKFIYFILNHLNIVPLLLLGALVIGQPVFADDCLLDSNNNGVADASVDTDQGANSNGIDNNLACGKNSQATGVLSTAVGPTAISTAAGTTAVGASANAGGDYATALGFQANATELGSTSLGSFSTSQSTKSLVAGYKAKVSTNSEGAIAIGNSASVNSNSLGAIAIGGDANADDLGAQASAQYAIAIGAEARATAEGAIAIGGDVDGDGLGAQATAENSIAIGADVVADEPNTMKIGGSLRITGSDEKTPLSVRVDSSGAQVETLLALNCKTCTPSFKFERQYPYPAQRWFFRMLQNGSFSIDDPSTNGKEAEFRSGGNLIIKGSLIQNSSRANKKHIVGIDEKEILEKINKLELNYWTYNHDNDRVRHLGPMAEEFYQLFGLGSTAKGISSIDTAGVSLAAVKALSKKYKTTQDELVQAQSIIDSKDKKIARLNQRLANMESSIGNLQKIISSIESEKQTIRPAEFLSVQVNTQ